MVLAFLLASTPGLKITLQVADKFLGVKASSAQGSLLGGFKLQDLVVDTDGLTLKIKTLSLGWQPSRLLIGRVAVEYLGVRDVVVTLKAVADESKTSDSLAINELLAPLPLEVNLKRLQVGKITIHNGAETPITIESVLLGLRLTKDQWALSPFKVKTRDAELSGKLSLVLDEGTVEQSELKWSAPIADIDAAGMLSLQGDYETLNLQHGCTKGIVCSQKFTLQNWQQSNPQFVLTMAGEVPEELTPANQLGYELRASGTLEALALEGWMKGVFEETNLKLRLSGSLNDDLLVIKRLDIDQNDKLVVEGNLFIEQLFSAQKINANLRWEDWLLPLSQDSASVSLIDGAIDVRGGLSEYQATARTDIQIDDLPMASLATAMSFDTSTANVSHLQLDWLDGQITGSAKAGWAGSTALTADLQAVDFNLAPVLSEELLLDGDAKVQLQAGQLNIHAALRGEGKGQPINADVTVVSNGPAQVEVNADIAANTSHAAINATLLQNPIDQRNTLNANWDLAINDLGDLLPGSKGQLFSKGKASGNVAKPKLAMNINAEQLAIPLFDVSLESLNVSAKLDPMQEAVDFSLDVRELMVARQAVNAINVNADGSLNGHNINLSANTPQLSVNGIFSGQLVDSQWTLKTESGQWQPTGFAPWLLAKPHTIQLSKTTAAISQGCWASGSSELCLDGSYKNGAADAALQLSSFDLSYLQSLLPPKVGVTGSVKGRAEIAFADALKGQAQFMFLPTQLVMTDQEAGDVELLNLATGELAARSSANELAVTLDWPLATEGEGVSVGLKAELAHSDLEQSTIAGYLRANTANLGAIEPFLPFAKSLKGRLDADLAISGTFAKPLPAGSIVLSEGQITLPDLGTQYDGIRLELKGNQAQEFELLAKAESERGSIQIGGTTDLQSDLVSAEMWLKGQSFVLANTQQAQVWVSPDIRLTANPERIRLKGALAVPEAHIQVTELPETAIGVSSDQIIVGEEREADNAGTVLDADLVVSLGENVRLDAFGFSGALAGDLNLRAEPEKPIYARGEIDVVKGEYRAFGQGLVVDKGRLLFEGDATNPGLDIRAIRRPAKNIVVGINARGTLQRPQTQIFSNPDMSSSDQLSWLIMGRPMQKNSGGESEYIAQAALAIGMRGQNWVGNDIGSALGLDEFGLKVGSGEAGAASDAADAVFRVGKYLTPKLYVSYGIGLLDALSTLRIKYELTDSVSLQSETSQQASGVDLNYSFGSQ